MSNLKLNARIQTQKEIANIEMLELITCSALQWLTKSKKLSLISIFIRLAYESNHQSFITVET